jgi:putative transposase
MKKSRLIESQIVAILKEPEDGIAITEVLGSHGISATTFYKWRTKYGGLEPF